MPTPIPLIVIDGGGSGTRLRAIAADGTPLAEATAGPSNLTFGTDPAWRGIKTGINALERQTGQRAIGTRLWCGLAGGRSPERQAQFRADDPVGCAQIVIVTDGFASLIGALGGQPGTVLAVGTGTAAFTLRADGHVVSASAWGYKIGDEGSGGWIGRRAVSLLSRRLDGRDGRDSLLFDALRSHVGADFDAIQSWLTNADATRFASLAPLVVDAAARGDAVATELLAQAADELVIAIKAVDAGGPLALLGGLGPVMMPLLPADLQARVVAPKGNALDGLQIMERFGWQDERQVPLQVAAHG